MQRFKTSILATLIGVGAGSAAVTAAPLGSDLKIDNIAIEGSGCDASSTSYLVAPDGESFTLIFDDFVVEVESDSGRQSKQTHCKVSFDVTSPAGWQHAIYFSQYRGFADLSQGAEVNATTLLVNAGSGPQIASFTKHNEFVGEFDQIQKLDLNKLSWSSCSDSRPATTRVTIVTLLRATANNQRYATISMDSLDGATRREVNQGVTWRSCARKPGYLATCQVSLAKEGGHPEVNFMTQDTEYVAGNNHAQARDKANKSARRKARRQCRETYGRSDRTCKKQKDISCEITAI